MVFHELTGLAPPREDMLLHQRSYLPSEFPSDHGHVQFFPKVQGGVVEKVVLAAVHCQGIAKGFVEVSAAPVIELDPRLPSPIQDFLLGGSGHLRWTQ